MRDGIRSRKVRTILKLEARVRGLLASAERPPRRPEPARRRADALLREVRTLEWTLTGSELGELRRRRLHAPSPFAEPRRLPRPAGSRRPC